MKARDKCFPLMPVSFTLVGKDGDRERNGDSAHLIPHHNSLGYPFALLVFGFDDKETKSLDGISWRRL
jgi:hypothetical protein